MRFPPIQVFRRLQTVATVAMLSIGAYASPAQAEDQAARTTLRFVPHADLSVIDPHWTAAYITRNHAYMVYDTLFALDHAFQPRPQMVERWSVSDDKLVWTFTLRSGLKFHDGQPVRAVDAVASLKRWGQRSGAYGQQLLAVVEAMDATDESTFRIVLKKPFPVLDALGTLSTPTPFIMPERLAKTDPYEQVKEAIGSGPFKFVKEEWQPGHKVVYVKNTDYVPRAEPPDWASGGKVAKVDRVEWRYIPDANTAAQALIAGEVDRWEVVPGDIVPMLERSPGVKVEVLNPIGEMALIRLNHLQPPFDNPKMRQALLYTVDQKQYMTAAAGDPQNWNTCFSIYACGTPLASDVGAEALAGARDYEKAKALIREAGYQNEKIVVLDPTDVYRNHAQALVTVDMLRKLGLNADLMATDWGTLVKKRASREPVDKGGWSIFPTTAAPYDMLNPVVNDFVRGNGLNAFSGWPTDAKIEEMIAAWFDAPDATAQREIAAAVQRRAFETVPYVPTGQFLFRTAFRNSVVGRVNAPIPFLWNIEKRQ